MKKRTQRLYRKDLSGQKFGKLTVISYAETRNRKPFWHCLCDCGTLKKLRSDHFQSGNTTSCGCAHIQACKEFPKHITHGKGHTPEYKIYHKIKQRCHNPNNPSYKNYGGRGIIMCERWYQSFPSFLEDMGTRPSPNHTIERVNNDGLYDPQNCIWATRKVQSRNQRKTIRLIIHNKQASLMEWAEIADIPPHAIRARLMRGWDAEKAVFTPLEPKYQHSPHPRVP